MKKPLNKYLLLFLLIPVFPAIAGAQIFSTSGGHIWFFSEAPLENIEAHNNRVACALNTSTGDMVFKVTIDRFEFEKDLMKKHFNENYLESENYPYATFNGLVEDFDPGMFQKDTTIGIIVSGELSLHGVTKKIKEKGTLIVKDNLIEGEALFQIKLEDYDIKIPRAVVKNIAEVVDVHVELNLKPFKKDKS